MHHEEFLHPNAEDVKRKPDDPLDVVGSMAPVVQQSKNLGCLTLMKRLDATILKPLLIYKYEQESHRKQKQYFEMLMKEGQHLEKLYAGSGGVQPVGEK